MIYKEPFPLISRWNSLIDSFQHTYFPLYYPQLIIFFFQWEATHKPFFLINSFWYVPFYTLLLLFRIPPIVLFTQYSTTHWPFFLALLPIHCWSPHNESPFWHYKTLSNQENPINYTYNYPNHFNITWCKSIHLSLWWSMVTNTSILCFFVSRIM